MEAPRSARAQQRPGIRLRFRTWAQVLSLCDTAESKPVHVHLPPDNRQVGESVTTTLKLPDGLTARVAAVVSDRQDDQTTIALIGITSALIARLRALAAPAEEAALARGSGTMKVSELLQRNSLLRAQIDALAAKMRPNDRDKNGR
jgi:hypothetical protein